MSKEVEVVVLPSGKVVPKYPKKKKKRKLSGIQIVTEFEGSTKTAYGRCDEYETEAEFMEAAQKAADDFDFDIIKHQSMYKVLNPRKCWIRINVCDPDLQEEFGISYMIAEVPGDGRRGRWESWAAEMEYVE